MKSYFKKHEKSTHRANLWVLVNVDSIVLIKVLRQLTLSDCSHICKWLKSQQLCQLLQFKYESTKRTPRKVLFVSIVILSNERLLNCDALQAFFRPSLESMVSVGLKTAQYQGF